jgi:CRP/FNR family nitrogen fixation transcriptional regulator
MTSTLKSLDRAQDHMMLLGRKTALEKVATFLFELAHRTASADRVVLPMPRADIADHLGLTIETVSRTLTQMVRGGLIRIVDGSHTIILADKVVLRQSGG